MAALNLNCKGCNARLMETPARLALHAVLAAAKAAGWTHTKETGWCCSDACRTGLINKEDPCNAH